MWAGTKFSASRSLGVFVVDEDSSFHNLPVSPLCSLPCSALRYYSGDYSPREGLRRPHSASLVRLLPGLCGEMGLLMSGSSGGYGAEAVPDCSNVPRLDMGLKSGAASRVRLLERDEGTMSLDLPGVARDDDGIKGRPLADG